MPGGLWLPWQCSEERIGSGERAAWSQCVGVEVDVFDSTANLTTPPTVFTEGRKSPRVQSRGRERTLERPQGLTRSRPKAMRSRKTLEQNSRTKAKEKKGLF